MRSNQAGQGWCERQLPHFAAQFRKQPPEFVVAGFAHILIRGIVEGEVIPRALPPGASTRIISSATTPCRSVSRTPQLIRCALQPRDPHPISRQASPRRGNAQARCSISAASCSRSWFLRTHHGCQEA